MEYRLKKLPKSLVEIEVILPFSEFEPYIRQAAVLLSEENEIEGFRRGKAPYDIVKKRFGEEKILDKAAEVAIKKTYPRIISELTGHNPKLKENGQTSNFKFQTQFIPLGPPEIAIIKLVPGNDLQYKAKIATLPEVKLPDYKSIAKQFNHKKRQAVEVTDEEIVKTLDWLRESRIKLVTVNRPAERGDRVEVDFETRHAGIKLNHGDSHNHPLVIGKGKFLPGFEEALIGMKAGDEKSFTLTVPEGWHEKNLAGKALDFRVKMLLVQQRDVPELNDEFAKSVGNFSSVESLKASVREGLLEEKKEKEKQRLRILLIEEIAKNAQIETPNILIERELNKMFEELKSGIEDIGIKWADYLLHLKKSEEELRRDWRDQAENRVRIALCLHEIANQEKIEPTEEEIETEANRYLARFQTADEAEKNIDVESLKEYSRGMIRNEKVFELLEAL